MLHIILYGERARITQRQTVFRQQKNILLPRVVEAERRRRFYLGRSRLIPSSSSSRERRGRTWSIL